MPKWSMIIDLDKCVACQGCSIACRSENNTPVVSPEEARKIILNVGNTVNPGGWLYVFGSGILKDSRLSPQAAVGINLVLINVYDHGRSYTESEHREWLNKAGFNKINFNYEKLC